MNKKIFKGGIKTFRFTWQQIVIAMIFILLIVVLLTGIVTRLLKTQTATDDTLLTEEPVNTPAATYDASENVISKEVFDGTILIESEDGGQEYIDETLFLGDSNTSRFLRFLNSDGVTYTNVENTIGVVGMGIDAISTLPCLDTSIGRLTMPQAVAVLQPRRMIVTFGTNNLNGTDTDATDFISRYEAQLKYIEETYPYADLIVNSIPPISEVCSYTNVSQIQIDAYNKAIVEMCKKNDWRFLNSAETLKNERTGYAKEGYMAEDGLHLSNVGLNALFEYIRTHCSEEEDTRPALSAVPAVYGVPDGLIKTNPLDEEEMSETECGSNAWGDSTGCYCNSGYEGDAYTGCTAIEENYTPEPETTHDLIVEETPEICSDPNAENNGSGCECKLGYQSSENGCILIPEQTQEPEIIEETSEPVISEEPLPEGTALTEEVSEESITTEETSSESNED